MHYVSVRRIVLDYFRKQTRRRYKPPQIGTYFPSVLTQSCLKGQWNYYMMSIREGQIPDGAIMRMGEGTEWHRILQSYKGWDGVEVKARMRVKVSQKAGDWITIRGRADSVKGDTVYEFKRTSWLPHKPKFDHVLQINFYMAAIGKPKGVIVYAGNKDGDFDVVEHPVLLSDWHVEHLKNRAMNLHIFLKNKEVPICSCRSRAHDIEWERYTREKGDGRV